MTPNQKPYREHLSKPQFKKRAFEVFDRDMYQCQFCGTNLTIAGPIHCHHRVFKSQGGDDQPDNLASACWVCHNYHGELKNKPLITENSTAKIDELRKRYA